jgi:hypothetical protein
VEGFHIQLYEAMKIIESCVDCGGMSPVLSARIVEFLGGLKGSLCAFQLSGRLMDDVACDFGVLRPTKGGLG